MSESNKRRSTGKKKSTNVELSAEEMAFAKAIGSRVRTEADLSSFSQQLKKIWIEVALGAEMEEHLGYEPYSKDGHGSENSRNGYSRKTIKGDIGEVEISVPRDRNAEFEPMLVKKGQSSRRIWC